MKTLMDGLTEFNEKMRRVESRPSVGPAVHIWKPLLVEDLDVEPILITSKRQYKEELKRRNLECRGLM